MKTIINATETDKILFLDIETAPAVYKYSELDENTKRLWDKKWQFSEDIDPAERYQKAGIYAEFAKVVCISFGNFYNGKFYVKAFSGHDEKHLLELFAEHLNTFYNKDIHNLCAHNGKEFDFPFLCRRMLINGVKLPKILSISGKKPWDVKFLDTMEMWKFGDHKNFTSLDLLAHVFKLPSPKGEIDGSDVARTYWEENDLEKIKNYCLRDVITLASVYCILNGEAPVSDEQLIFATV
jgi:DNA polymerase elongation subunit (family B)